MIFVNMYIGFSIKSFWWISKCFILVNSPFQQQFYCNVQLKCGNKFWIYWPNIKSHDHMSIQQLKYKCPKRPYLYVQSFCYTMDSASAVASLKDIYKSPLLIIYVMLTSNNILGLSFWSNSEAHCSMKLQKHLWMFCFESVSQSLLQTHQANKASFRQGLKYFKTF